jgi:hypothetical protein
MPNVVAPPVVPKKESKANTLTDGWREILVGVCASYELFGMLKRLRSVSRS